MEGNTHLTARLSRRYDLRGEDVEMPAPALDIGGGSLFRAPATLAVAVADICIWNDRSTFHQEVEALLLDPGQHGRASGVEIVSPAAVARLRNALQQEGLGLPPSDREDALIALGEALQGFAARDLSPVFEYSWVADL